MRSITTFFQIPPEPPSVLPRVAAAAALVAAGAVGTLLWADNRWERRTREPVAELNAAAAQYQPRLAEIDTLPLPVQRYFSLALPPDRRSISRARLRQTGEFAMQPGAAMQPFDATQYINIRSPGFVWDASIRTAPAISVRVRDAYVAGEGRMQAKMMGLIPVIERRDSAGLATGALVRYLAEAVWVPPALLPAAGVEWSPIDAYSARATITDAGKAVSLDFAFGAGGAVEMVRTTRPRDVDGRSVETLWEGRFSDYGRVDGLMIPRYGEVAWVLPEGEFIYWRGRIVDATFMR